MKTRFQVGAAALLAATFLAGCATSSQYEQGFGQSVRATLAAQVIDPAAGAKPNTATGIDAQAALGAQQNYEQSFSAPGNDKPGMVAGNAK